MAVSDREPDKKPTHMREMLERLGVDPATGVLAHCELTFMTALHRCQNCPSKAACRAWLDSMPMSVAFAPKFCPNSDLFFELQFDQPGHIRGPYSDLCKPVRTAAKPARDGT
jgi:hypothetical protein